MRAAHQRVQVVGLAKLFYRQIRQPGSLDRAGDAGNQAQQRRQDRSLAHMGVHEQRTAWLKHASHLAERGRQPIGRQVLEHVNRVGLCHAAVGERQLPELADDQIDGRERLPREERPRVRTDEVRPRLAAPDTETPAAAPEIEHDILRPHVEKFPQHRVAYGGRQERRRDRLVTAVGMKALVQKFCRFVERVARPQHEKVPCSLVKRSTASRTLQVRRPPFEPCATIRTPDDLKEARRDHGGGWRW